MIAGACTFLNVYCTQPLLPFFQKFFHATEVQVSLTVGAICSSFTFASSKCVQTCLLTGTLHLE
jgi:hypothetical protein